MIPDIKLHTIIDACVKCIRLDFESHGATPSNTIMWHLLNDEKMSDTGRFKWYEQAKEIFINRTNNHPKFLESRLFFDRERAAIPTIHIMVSGEGKGKDGIGMDVGFEDEQVIGTTQRSVLNRQFDMNANIVITSDNTFETVIIYHIIKAMLISISTHIQLVGFINPVITGRDINISQELVPNGTYARSVNFSASYELSVPEVVVNRIGTSVWMQMQNINNVELDEPKGPKAP